MLVNHTDMNSKKGYTMAGNFTLKRQLPGDVVLQMGYVTNNSVGLYASEWPNAYFGALPQYTSYLIGTPGLGTVRWGKGALALTTLSIAPSLNLDPVAVVLLANLAMLEGM
jgi:hypothetical protein